MEKDDQISLYDHPELFEKVVDILIERNDISYKNRKENLIQIQLLNLRTIDYFDSEDNCILSNIDLFSSVEYSYLEKPENLKQAIHSVLETLTSREMQILILRFGLDGEQPRTLEKVKKDDN